ncbi:UNVERIFIED_CONTAM: hypothetical protein GTU68_037542 [Idotea baltica]|nr:hypothetical protein [Idotea baltica]
MEVYARSEGIVIDRKADDSPLTEADTLANAHIVKELLRLYPDIPIISEEEKLRPYSERKDWDVCWEVDPLDGTKEFINRNGEFTVNIALLQDGQSVAGVIYAPVPELTAWAQAGQGAWSISGLENWAGFQAGEKIKIVASRSHGSPEMQAYLAQFADPEVRNAGSSLKFLLVATGEAHLYPRLAPTMEWDTSAGQAILSEAGGEILVEPGEAPLLYNREDLLNPHFIAYAAGLRAVLKDYFKA